MSITEWLKGDGANETVASTAVKVANAPIKILSVKVGEKTFQIPYRFAGNPETVILVIHGGFTEYALEQLKSSLMAGPVTSRLLKQGYGIAAATFQTYMDNPQSKQPIVDVRAIYQAVKKLPGVKHVFIFGGSGGGSLALDVAALEKPDGIILGEPASVIFFGMLKTTASEDIGQTIGNANKLYTPELRNISRVKLEKITCPILVLQGTIHDLKIVNKEILIPELRTLKKNVTFAEYPGAEHGFYFGHGNTKADTIENVAGKIAAFIQTSLTTQVIAQAAPIVLSTLFSPKVKTGLYIGGGLLSLYVLAKVTRKLY